MDGRTIVTISDKHALELSVIDPDEMIAIICANIGERMTEEQWRQFVTDDEPIRACR
jgi:hypothetical protein